MAIQSNGIRNLLGATALVALVAGCGSINADSDYATVLAVTPVYADVTTSREVCNDRQVQNRLPERDGDVGGTVAGAVVGGLLGNQVGKGSGRKAATVAGAVAGGLAGREIDRRHEGGRVVTEEIRDCVQVPESHREIAGYDVTIDHDGEQRVVRMAEPPEGERIAVRTELVVGGSPPID